MSVVEPSTTTRTAKRARASTMRVDGQRLRPDVVVTPTDALQMMYISEEHVYIAAGIADDHETGEARGRRWVVATCIALDEWPNDASLRPVRFGAPKPHDIGVVFESVTINGCGPPDSERACPRDAG
jgi:hypothetical protein